LNGVFRLLQTHPQNDLTIARSSCAQPDAGAAFRMSALIPLASDPPLHRFADRRVAGRELAKALEGQLPPGHLIVLGLPRGGVPVAEQVARALGAPLDVLPVRKVGLPSQPELAIGAIAASKIVVHEPQALQYSGVSTAEFERLAQRERAELARREQLYRHGFGPLSLIARDVVLVDDGIATGATMMAAVRAARAMNANSITVAAPVASPEAVERLRAEVDRLVILETPAMFLAVGEWYLRFEPTSDEEVCECLRRAPEGH
jgi:predicted phosphoribosyltransferase